MPRENVVAFHEAGHAVAAWACGVGVKSISLQTTHGSLGQVYYDLSLAQEKALQDNEAAFLKSLCVMGLGGMAADYTYSCLIGAEPEELIEGGGSDQVKVRRQLGQIGHVAESDFETYFGMTLQIFKEPARWAVVDSVATALIQHGSVSATDIQKFAKATPKLTPEFWEKLEQARLGLGVRQVSLEA